MCSRPYASISAVIDILLVLAIPLEEGCEERVGEPKQDIRVSKRKSVRTLSHYLD